MLLLCLQELADFFTRLLRIRSTNQDDLKVPQSAL
jgi:hypothetical protein